MINKRSLTIFEGITNIDDMKEMSEIELMGAISFVYSLAVNNQYDNFGEVYIDFNEVSNKSFYCREVLSLNDNYGYIIKQELDKQLILDSVFMRECTNDTLWGWAYWYDTETEESTDDMFLVRIS